MVADASIMPTVPRANTNLTSIMIGEKVGSGCGRGHPSTGCRSYHWSGMIGGMKVKTSVSLSEELLAEIDREAGRAGDPTFIETALVATFARRQACAQARTARKRPSNDLLDFAGFRVGRPGVRCRSIRAGPTTFEVTTLTTLPSSNEPVECSARPVVPGSAFRR